LGIDLEIAAAGQEGAAGALDLEETVAMDGESKWVVGFAQGAASEIAEIANSK